MTLRLYLLVLAWVAAMNLGCGGKAPPVVKQPVVTTVKKPELPSKPVVAPVCVTAGATENRVSVANGNVSSAQFCIASQDDTMCYGVEFSTSEYIRLPTRPDSQLPTLEAPTAKVNVTEKAVEVCVGEPPCKALKYKVTKAAPPTSVAINQAGTTVAIAAGKSPIEVWDVTSNKKLTSIKFAKKDYRCGTPVVVGDVLAISVDVCAGPGIGANQRTLGAGPGIGANQRTLGAGPGIGANQRTLGAGPVARGALFTKAGKRIADIGGPDFGSFGLRHTQVDGNIWAFLEESASRLVLQDVVTGKIISTVPLTGFWTNESQGTKSVEPPLGEPGESALVRGGPGKLIVVGGSPGPGSVAVVDLDNGAAKVTRPAMCPAK